MAFAASPSGSERNAAASSAAPIGERAALSACRVEVLLSGAVL